MKLDLEWYRSFPLKDATDVNMIYSLNLSRLPSKAGVYIFGRKWGDGFEALYVGKADRIRGRVKGQLNNLRLMQHLRNSKTGKRILLAGVLRTRPGQQLAKCLKLVERGLIRHFLSEGHDLVNKQGTRISRHEISSFGKQPKKFIPSPVYVEKSGTE